jgi:hypothetical protein
MSANVAVIQTLNAQIQKLEARLRKEERDTDRSSNTRGTGRGIETMRVVFKERDVLGVRAAVARTLTPAG